jgi:hypothetical protein
MGNKNVSLAMKEVLSVPAGQSYPCIAATLVHSCPPSYPYKPFMYITFRQPGGKMEALYKVESLFILKPHDKSALERLNPTYQGRVQSYIDQRERLWPFADKGYRRFYVLKETEQIELSHKPKLLQNIQGHCYFTLDELLSGKKIVQVASKLR